MVAGSKQPQQTPVDLSSTVPQQNYGQMASGSGDSAAAQFKAVAKQDVPPALANAKRAKPGSAQANVLGEVLGRLK